MISQKDNFDLHLKWHFPDAKRYGFAFIILFISLSIIYRNSFDCEFHFDDFPNIVNNPNLHLKSLSWENIRKTFYGCNDIGTKISRPLSYLTLALNYYIGGEKVFGYHMVNFVIHYITAIFLFLLIYNTLKLPLIKARYEKTAYSITLLSVFLWTTHPVQVPTVTYIVQRMASMASMFYIMAMYFYLKGRTADAVRKKIGLMLGCGIAALFAFASKENTAMLPFTLIIYDLLLIRGAKRESLKHDAKMVLVPLLIFFFLTVFYTDISKILNAYEYRPFTLFQRLLTEPRVILFYISLLLYPIDSRMTFLYDIEISQSVLSPWTTLPAIFLILLIIGIAVGISRKRPLIAFCILFFFLNHLIEGSIIPLELIYEHRNYLPSAFFLVLPALLMLKILDYFSYQKSIQFLFGFVFTFVISAQAHTVYSRNETYKTDFVLWSDNIEKSPNLSRPHNNLGKFYWDEGFYEEAFREVNKAIHLNNISTLKTPAIYHENIGMYYLKIKDYDQAMRHLQISHNIYATQSHPRTLYGITMIYYYQNNLKEAYKFIQKAISDAPYKYKADYYLILSLIYFKSGDIGKSIEVANEALQIKPDYDLPLTVLAEAFKRKEEYEMAIYYWEEFLKKNPTYIIGHFALIELFFIIGNDEELNRIMGRIIYLKGKNNYLDVMCEQGDITVYLSEPDVLLPIFRYSLLNQYKEVNLMLE